MNNIAQIQCFIKVAELKSFSNAAGVLHITTTAVSKQIKNLESHIGEQLFVRTTRLVCLTEFGQALYERCKLLEKQLIHINQFVESKKESPQGELKVLVSTILSKSFVLKYLSQFIYQYPNIRLELIFSEEDLDINRDDIDIMVGFPLMPPITDTLRYRRMYTVKNMLCASREFIEKYGKPTAVEDLIEFKFITHSLRKPGNRLPLNNGLWINCAEPILYMNNFAALNEACRDGIGIFLSGDLTVGDFLATGELVQLLPDVEFRSYEIYIFYRAYDYELPKIRAFVDFYSQVQSAL